MHTDTHSSIATFGTFKHVFRFVAILVQVAGVFDFRLRYWSCY